MDIRTGRTYESREAAVADGVPESDVATILERRLANGDPIVKFTKGSFKSFKRNKAGELAEKAAILADPSLKKPPSGRRIVTRGAQWGIWSPPVIGCTYGTVEWVYPPARMTRGL